MDINYDEMLNIVDSHSTPIASNLSNDILFDPKINFRLKENLNTAEGYFEPKDGEYAPKGSLWNNPAINKMKEKMTDKQLEYFENQGSNMYNYDFAKADIDADLKEITEYVICGLRSGLSPSDMSEDEKDAMCEIYGPTWYTQYGFSEEDVYDD